MQKTRPVFPVGCKFLPSDKELVEYYLFNKICGNPDPFNYCFVNEEDLYGIKEPWAIWEEYGGANLEDGVDIYFFTHLKKKSVKGLRNDRKVGSGVWQGEDGGKVIKSCNSRKKIGLKKRYRYENKGSPHHGCWIMHEYTLNASLLPQNCQSNDYVLCRIKKNGEPEQAGKTKSGKKRKIDEQDEDILQPEPVLVENHQYQYVQENQLQLFIEQTPNDQLQPFQNHQLMQRTPSYFFRAQEETDQLSVTEQNPQDLQLSEYHQNMQHTPVTDHNSNEQLHLSVENPQLYISSGLQEYQQIPATDQSPPHQLELSVEDYESTVHDPFIMVDVTQEITHDQLEFSVENHQYMVHNHSNIEENQPLTATEQRLYDQLEQSIENHQSTLHNPPNLEGNQQLPSTEQSLYDRLEQVVGIHQSTLHNPSKFEENQQLPATCLYDQPEQSVDNHQHMFQNPSDIEGYQQLPTFHGGAKWSIDSSDDNDFVNVSDLFC